MLDNARRGQSSIVSRGDGPLMLTLPLEPDEAARRAAGLLRRLYDRDQIGLVMAARIADLYFSDMLDDLGWHCIATVRLRPSELGRELVAF